MSARKILFPAALFIFLSLGAFIRVHDPGDEITSLLARYNEMFAQEKVHLHLDRNYFAAGDTLNFKAYVVTAENNRFSDTSKILYINLVDAARGYSTTLRYPLEGGTTSGAIELADTLKAGTYTLSAYTNWMKNFGEEFFYHTSLKIGALGIGSQPVKNITQAKSVSDTHTVYFFPEGGALVEQLTSVIGFKAIDKNGKGEDVSGSVVDESGKTITPFRSAFGGMGRFNLKPEPGHRYVAVVKFKDGAVKKVPLPVAVALGYVLTINNQEKNEIRITINHKGPAVQQPVSLVAQANNKLINITKAILVNNTATVSLPRRQFPTGIAQLTLFDPAAVPVAERLVFVNRRDQLRLQLSVTKATAANSGIKATLQVTDALLNPVSAEFSVAVLDQSRVSDSLKIPSIMADLLLTSDLKGTIENPNHYFNDNLPEAALLLDNLMLTQGWRRFTWKDLMAGNNPKIIYPAEKSQMLSGTVTTAKGSPLPNTKVMLVPKTDSTLAVNTITDSKGHFVFSFPQLYGEQQFTIIGAGPGGSKDVKITLDDQSMPPVKIPVAPAFQPESIDKRLNSYLAVQQQFYTGPKTRQLKEVVIKGKQLTLEEKALEASSNLNGAGNADQVITYKDLGYCKDLEQCLQGKLTGVFFKLILDAFSNTYKKVPFSSGANKPMLIVRDGIPMPSGQSFLVDVPAGDVQSVEVLRTGARASIYGMQASGGAIIITTKRGGINYNAMYESKPLAPGFLAVTYNGYNKSREFYTPPVNAQNPKISTAETLYWNTRVKTNDDGQAIIEFAPGTNVKKIAITVEGLSAEGKTGYLYQEETL